MNGCKSFCIIESGDALGPARRRAPGRRPRALRLQAVGARGGRRWKRPGERTRASLVGALQREADTRHRPNLLGLARPAGLRDGVLLAEVVTKTNRIDLSAYPPWLQVLVGTLAAALVIWILMKLLKWTLWLLLLAVLIGGVIWTLCLLLGL